MEKIYHDKTECSGCGLCVSVCSRTAISMKKDCYGFFYPQIEQSKCIDCGQCKQSCAFGEATMFAVKTSYAAVNKNREQLMSSASGGIFSAVAEAFLKDGGVVCGAHMTFNNGYAKVEHEVIESPDKLYQLQGSKYIQSNIQVAFRDVLSYLKQGKAVLFSGTPCQVAAMRKYVPLRYEESLFTMDIICHGVPSQKIFNDYIQYVSKKKKIIAEAYIFRDKKYGWGLYGRMEGKQENGKLFTERIGPDNASYYKFFFDGEIYRDCCYSCPYAKDKRVGDLTIGDYWGIDKYNPELLQEHGGIFSKRDGVSCLLVNTEKGQKFLDEYGKGIKRIEVDLENIKIVNTQLSHPAIHTKLRNHILSVYATKGYSAVEDLFDRICMKRKIKKVLKRIIGVQ